MVKNRFVLAALTSVLFMSGTSYGLSINTSVHTGYDSNPLTLADKFDPKSANYVQLKSSLKQKMGKGLSAKISVKARRFSANASDANKSQAKLKLAYKTTIGNKKKSKIALDVQGGMVDKTYVPHSTGVAGTFNGADISERYNNYWWSTSATLSRKVSRSLNANFGVEYLHKDFENYDIDGLSNLDYQQFVASTRWRYRFSKAHRSILDFGISHRNYDDKRQANLTGVDIADTDLTYLKKFVKLSHRFKVTKYLTLEGKLSYFDRVGNGSGYYDFDQYSVELASRYRIMRLSNIQAKVSYKKGDYKKRSEGNESLEADREERFSEREGTVSTLRFETRLPFAMLLSKRRAREYPTTFVQWKYSDFDSNDENYVYNRQQIEAGINFHF